MYYHIHSDLEFVLVSSHIWKIADPRNFGYLEYHSFLNGRVVSQGDTPVLTCEPFWFLSSEFTLFPMISRMFFLSIVIKRLYLLTVIVQFRIWFMSSKLISNAVADVMLKFWYSISHNSSNIGILNPPYQSAKDNIFLPLSVIKILPVTAAINSVRTTRLTFLKSLPMPGIVLI